MNYKRVQPPHQGGHILTVIVLVLLLNAWGCRSAGSSGVSVSYRLVSVFKSYDGLDIMNPTAMVVTDSGEFYVSAKNRVVRLDASGVVQNQIGRPGQGPGELQGVNAIGISRDRLIAFEPMRNLVTEFLPEGTFLRSYPLPVAGVNRLYLLDGGRFLLEVPGSSTRLVLMKDMNPTAHNPVIRTIDEQTIPPLCGSWLGINGDSVCFLGGEGCDVYEYDAARRAVFLRVRFGSQLATGQARPDPGGPVIRVPRFQSHYFAFALGPATVVVNGKDCDSGEFVPRDRIATVTVIENGAAQCLTVPFTFHENLIAVHGDTFYLMDNLDQRIHGFRLIRQEEESSCLQE